MSFSLVIEKELYSRYLITLSVLLLAEMSLGEPAVHDEQISNEATGLWLISKFGSKKKPAPTGAGFP
jgi:hypothetical protein